MLYELTGIFNRMCVRSGATLSTDIEAIADELERATASLRVVLCGSFRRDPKGLKDAFNDLRLHYTVVAPTGLDFVDPTADFVRLEADGADEISAIEGRHLSAISNADFVWLHVADGYVGASATMEIGHARALGIPVFASAAPLDATLASFVSVVDDPAQVLDLFRADPGSGLLALQSYYRRTALRRGWGDESPRDTLLLITEEMGELARAIRKAEGLSRDQGYVGTDAASELADVQLYLLHLANSLGVDLASAVTAKERVNAERHALRESAA